MKDDIAEELAESAKSTMAPIEVCLSVCKTLGKENCQSPLWARYLFDP